MAGWLDAWMDGWMEGTEWYDMEFLHKAGRMLL